MATHRRYCRACGGRLAHDNSQSLCGPCLAKSSETSPEPPTVPNEFWRTDQMTDALASWHFGKVVQAYRHHPHHGRVLTQRRVGHWLGLNQSQLSRLETGPAETDLAKLTAWAKCLQIPPDLLWFRLPPTSTEQLSTRRDSH